MGIRHMSVPGQLTSSRHDVHTTKKVNACT